MTSKTPSLPEQVLDYAVQYWVNHRTGCDSLRIAQDLKRDNEEIKEAMIELEASGLASLNKDAPLVPIAFSKGKMVSKPTVLW